MGDGDGSIAVYRFFILRQLALRVRRRLFGILQAQIPLRHEPEVGGRFRQRGFIGPSVRVRPLGRTGMAKSGTDRPGDSGKLLDAARPARRRLQAACVVRATERRRAQRVFLRTRSPCGRDPYGAVAVCVEPSARRVGRIQ